MSPVNPWRFYDRVYHIFKPILGQLVLGLIGGTIITNFLFSGLVGVGDPRHWLFVRVVLDNGLIALFVFLGIGLTAAFAIIGHLLAHPYEPITFVTRLRVKHLNAVRDGLLLGLGSNAPQAYFAWDGCETAVANLRSVMHRGGGIWLTGVAGVGKTRMALEAVQKALPQYTLIPLNQRILPGDLMVQPGERIVFWLDDILARGSTVQEALTITGLVHAVTVQLKGRIPPLLVVTCTSAESALVRTRYRSLLQGILPQEIPASIPQDVQWAAFLQWAEKQHLNPERKQFDGTPGSVILDLEARVAEFQRLDPVAQTLLEFLAICFAGKIRQWTSHHLQPYAAIVVGLDEVAWLRGLTVLLADRWLIAEGRNFLIPVEAYLTKVLPRAGFPRETPIWQDRLHHLVEWCSEHADRERIPDLYALSDALADGIGAFDDAEELRRRCIDRALALLADEPPSPQSAEGQERLGQFFVDEDQPEEAVLAFREALQGYAPEVQPVERAHVLVEIGDSLRDVATPEAIEESIEVYTKALDVFTPLAFPAEHAEIQTWLADSHYEQYRREQRPEALDHAITALEQAVQVESREQDPEQWAERSVTLGDRYIERAAWRREDQSKAVVAFQQALKVYTPQHRLFEWARITTTLGDAIRRRPTGQALSNARQAEGLHRDVLAQVGREQNEHVWREAQYELAWDLLAEALADTGHKADLMEAASLILHELHAQVAPHSHWDARLMSSLGVVATRYGHWDEALAYYDQAGEVYSPIADAHNWGVLQQNRGSCYDAMADQARHLGDTQTCLRYRELAVQVYTDSIQSFGRARSRLAAENVQRDLDRTRVKVCS